MERRADVWFAECKLPQYFKSWLEFTLQRQLQEQRRRKAEDFNWWAANSAPNQEGGFRYSTSHVFFAFSVDVSTPGCFTPGGDSQRSTRRRCCLSRWYVSSRRKLVWCWFSPVLCSRLIASCFRLSSMRSDVAYGEPGFSGGSAHDNGSRRHRNRRRLAVFTFTGFSKKRWHSGRRTPQRYRTGEDRWVLSKLLIRLNWSLRLLLCLTAGEAESYRPVVGGTCAAWDQL